MRGFGSLDTLGRPEYFKQEFNLEIPHLELFGHVQHNHLGVQDSVSVLSDESPPEGEAWMPFLIRKRRFLECIVLGWQSVENYVDQMAIQEFELLLYPKKTDPRIDILRDRVGFGTKVEFLNQMGRISEEDQKTIFEFYKERNALFHGDIFTSRHPVVVPEPEKTRLMELAGKASQIAMNRTIGVWTDEGTGDLGNKGIAQPGKPENVKRINEMKKQFFGG